MVLPYEAGELAAAEEEGVCFSFTLVIYPTIFLDCMPFPLWVKALPESPQLFGLYNSGVTSLSLRR